MPKTQKPATEKVTIELPPGVSKEAFEAALAKAASQPREEEDVVLKTVTKTDKSEHRIGVSHYKGREQLYLQEWYQERDDPTWKPGRKSTFHYEELEDVIDGLQRLKEWCEEHPKGD